MKKSIVCILVTALLSIGTSVTVSAMTLEELYNNSSPYGQEICDNVANYILSVAVARDAGMTYKEVLQLLSEGSDLVELAMLPFLEPDMSPREMHMRGLEQCLIRVNSVDGY